VPETLTLTISSTEDSDTYSEEMLLLLASRI